ncbi:hypothetical protein swp_1177 [Shewanella piezotolerans WP3]|uniref:Uncharacterized protein n=1 Tax=Shewanella piezotolerans (strain WP3 / JCM 13877) TaxID=225849 RepID=B8CKD4_SHEPW|nr:hypothetical protein [Shewanella piezotolerans]ACJ27973.1 hypothetical protein swp_1177 [Shewanella piezotolerans WP3]
MIISAKNSVHESDNQLIIERLLSKIRKLEQQLELAESDNRAFSSSQATYSSKSALSADELSMLTTLF